jgi:hypothetical protein
LDGSPVRLGISSVHCSNSPNQPSGIYYLRSKGQRKEIAMADAPRITIDELKRRMEAGEDFTLIDVRNPEAWAESDTTEAIRMS